MLQRVDASAAGDETIVPAVSVPAEPKSSVDSLAILGSNPATVGAAPFGQGNWAILGCSPDNTPYGHSDKAQSLPRVDQWYELHDPIEDPSRPFGYLYHIATTMPVVWMRDKRAMSTGFFKGARPYPEEHLKGTSKIDTLEVRTGTFAPAKDKKTGKTGFAELVEKRDVEVPNGDGLFYPHMFTSSIAYMLAQSIIDCEEKGISTIGLWGIMQQSNNEYAYQRPGIQYFLNEAKKRGIKIVANRESCLFDMPNWNW